MSKSNVWMSVSDLMTGLMVIFLFIAISYIRKVQDNQTAVIDFFETKARLHEKMVNEFAGDTARWQMSIGKDLSMRFNNPQVLFASGKAEITPAFQDILDEFLPKYMQILLEDSLRNRIVEIRIEGHTDTVPYPSRNKDAYIANVILSQERALSVLKYFREMDCFANYSDEEKKLMEYWFTANGLSYGRALDSNGEYTIESNNQIDLSKSRRVEFRIVTSGEKVLENFVEKLYKE